MFAVIRMGKHGWPCGVSIHETRGEACSAADEHAEAHGRKLTGRLADAFAVQLLTEAESMHSYLILPVGNEDDETHGFA
jgi:hypothetical protein